MKYLRGGRIVVKPKEMLELILTKKDIDYKLLADSWAEKVFAKAKIQEEKCDGTMSYKDGYNRGMYDAFYLAVTMFTMEEDIYLKNLQK